MNNPLLSVAALGQLSLLQTYLNNPEIDDIYVVDHQLLSIISGSCYTHSLVVNYQVSQPYFFELLLPHPFMIVCKMEIVFFFLYLK